MLSFVSVLCEMLVNFSQEINTNTKSNKKYCTTKFAIEIIIIYLDSTYYTEPILHTFSHFVYVQWLFRPVIFVNYYLYLFLWNMINKWIYHKFIILFSSFIVVPFLKLVNNHVLQFLIYIVYIREVLEVSKCIKSYIMYEWIKGKIILKNSQYLKQHLLLNTRYRVVMYTSCCKLSCAAIVMSVCAIVTDTIVACRATFLWRNSTIFASQ